MKHMHEIVKIALIGIAVICVGVFIAACRKGSSAEKLDSAGSVYFNIRQLSAVDSSEGQVVTWLGTHNKSGKEARFRIELTLKEPKQGNPFTFGAGAFFHEEPSDPVVLLEEIAQALEAKQVRPGDSRTNKLSFTTAILGRNLSRGPGKDLLAGSFTSDPKGDWIAVKVFVADGEGEFFLNLNSRKGQGEFSIKDPEYGDVVVRELAKVL